MKKEFLDKLYLHKFTLDGIINNIKLELNQTQTCCEKCGHESSEKLNIRLADYTDEMIMIDQLIVMYLDRHQ